MNTIEQLTAVGAVMSDDKEKRAFWYRTAVARGTRVLELMQERDELLAALEAILTVDNARQAHIIARAAIASATGEQS